MPRYRLDPDELIAVVRSVLGLPIEEQIEGVLAELAERYPGHINQTPRWVFSKAGGLLGTMMLVHASLREYVLIFGCPHGSEGFSGRYRTALWDIVMSGELRTNQAHELTARRHGPGDCSRLRPGQANHSRLTQGTFLLEYARGPIPSMLPFGLLEVATSTLDGHGLASTLAQYTRCVTRSLVADLRGRLR